MIGDYRNGRFGDRLRQDSSWPDFSDSLDVEEFPLLLTTSDVRALIDAAGRQGISPAAFARRVITDFLERTGGSACATHRAAGRAGA
jgi:hypothetical protein